MRKAAKALGVVVGVLLAVALVVWGVRAYNLNHYAVPGPDRTNRALAVSEHGGIPVDGDYLRGIRYPGDLPGTVITFGGSEGTADDARARELNRHGYDVLALYFFGQPGQQDSLADVPLEFFTEALALADDDGPVTVIGTSKGAELGANLAVRYPEIDNLVLFAPSEYTYAGLQFDSAEQVSSFTWEGEPVPFAPFGNDLGMVGRLILGLPISYRPTYEAAAAAAPPESRIDIPLFDGRGLLFAGDADPMWQSEVAARGLAERNPGLKAHILPDAGHLFADDITQFGPSWEVMLGGTVEANREAKEVSDRILLDHLAQWHTPGQG